MPSVWSPCARPADPCARPAVPHVPPVPGMRSPVYPLCLACGPLVPGLRTPCAQPVVPPCPACRPPMPGVRSLCTWHCSLPSAPEDTATMTAGPAPLTGGGTLPCAGGRGLGGVGSPDGRGAGSPHHCPLRPQASGAVCAWNSCPVPAWRSRCADGRSRLARAAQVPGAPTGDRRACRATVLRAQGPLKTQSSQQRGRRRPRASWASGARCRPGGDAAVPF